MNVKINNGFTEHDFTIRVTDRAGHTADLLVSSVGRVPVAFTEELVPPGVARTLARETGVPTEVLSPIEGLTPSERRSGADYWSLMAANRGRLARAMGCVSR